MYLKSSDCLYSIYNYSETT